MKKEINDNLTYQIIGCAMKVHPVLGSGLQEVILSTSIGYRHGKTRTEFCKRNGDGNLL